MKETFLRDHETNMKQNGYLLAQIANRYQLSEDLTSLFNLADYYNKIDAAMIKDAARLYLKNDNFVKVTLFPKKRSRPVCSNSRRSPPHAERCFSRLSVSCTADGHEESKKRRIEGRRITLQGWRTPAGLLARRDERDRAQRGPASPHLCPSIRPPVWLLNALATSCQTSALLETKTVKECRRRSPGRPCRWRR